MQRHLMAVASLALCWAGCAAVSPRRTASRAATGRALSVALPDGTDTSGVWDWMFRSTDDQGDMRVEQEEWHLVQKGRASRAITIARSP